MKFFDNSGEVSQYDFGDNENRLHPDEEARRKNLIDKGFELNDYGDIVMNYHSKPEPIKIMVEDKAYVLPSVGNPIDIVMKNGDTLKLSTRLFLGNMDITKLIGDK